MEIKNEIKSELIENNYITNDSLNNEEDNEDKCGRSRQIHIDMKAIPCVEDDEQEEELRALGITAYHQSVYEEAVMLQVDHALDTTHGKSDSVVDSPLDVLNNANNWSTKDSNTQDFEIVSHMNDDNNESIASGSKTSHGFQRKTISYSNTRITDSYNDSENSDKEAEEEEWHPSGDDNSDENDRFDDSYEDYDSDLDPIVVNKTLKDKKVKKSFNKSKKVIRKKIIDDGNDKSFRKRIDEYKEQRLIEKQNNIQSDGTEVKDLNEMVKIDDAFQIPKRIWDQLFGYQQTGVQWLWELHKNGCGGIVGDEMGLGKTIQVIAFLCGLSCSRFHDFRDLYTSLGPVILVCPATVMHQWVAEFHKWWPYFRVAILHQTGSYVGSKQSLIKGINKANGILITSYSGVFNYHKQLLNHDWHYVILDEGHKIRNPDAQVTHACKMFNTPHRIILSGSPIQNNLRELWSLFDFVYPGKLGTLPVFMEHFAVPITQGGYANATQVQIQIAYKCATVLRDSIKPYLLRRMKDEVKSCLTLPPKNEQVLFCRLTDEQRNLYKQYLDSSEVKDIIRGSTQIFVGLINIRKICNHPSLFLKNSDLNINKNDCDYYKRSGKMIVVDALLRLWHKQKHKVLVFTQSRQFLKILENFVNYRGYAYLKMDGSTSVQSRQPMIKQFNEDPKTFVFLLTTRVGGIGVNLTGANRVLIYDPDWNPSTDIQARERCWRIGQNKTVTIYRLLSAGTVEEKIYHRQIFKQYLTNRVLKDPKQRRFFKTNDLHELFTLGSDSDNTESSAIFAGTDSEVKVNPNAKKPKTKSNASQSQLPPEKVEELRIRAKLLSKMIAEKFSNKNEKLITDTNVETNSSENYSNAEKGKEIETKKKMGIKFEGKRIKYLVKQDHYIESVPEKQKNAEDEYVLKKLFKKSKVHSALQHDVLECNSSTDFALAEREAETVAKQAINALKRSRELCFVGQSGSNSWNGLNSIAVNKKFGQKTKSNESDNCVSSSSLMNDMRKRNKFQPEPESAVMNDSGISGSTSEYDTLLTDMRTYIGFRSSKSGEASTQELLEAFKTRLPPHQSALFKSLLYQLCHFHRRSDKVGVWTLKSEFR